MTNRVVSRQANHMWVTPQGISGLNSACQKLVQMKRPSCQEPPAGVCIQELATMIQKAERLAPRATIAGGEQMHPPGDPPPAEEHHPQEAGLQHEGQGRFKAQDIAEKTAGGHGKAGPVGAELELQGHAAHHPHGKIEQEQFAPKAGVAVVVVVPGLEPQGLQDHQEQAEAHGEHRPGDVKHGGQGKLEPGEHDRIEPGFHKAPC